MSVHEILVAAFLLCGCFIAMASGVGVLRMPDFYSRMHPAGKNDTLAQTLILIGLMLAAGFSQITVKLFLLWLFLFLTTPSSTHALARAAYVDRREPWKNGEERR